MNGMSGESGRHQRLGLAFSGLGQYSEAAKEYREKVEKDTEWVEKIKKRLAEPD